ncbi:MAG TPA: hypothetical protein VN493_27500 [Thermoanaerobaculia bacterium]|nr:hypothetical protein [Thermoanaerobaculia bacterium]
MRTRALFAGLFLVCAAAQAQSVSVVDTSCIPRKTNGVLRASIIPDPSVGQSPRIYFRWKEQPAFYWAPMEVEPNGRYWAVLPRVEDRNHEVEYYVAVVDAAGKMLAQSEPRSVKVQSSCQANLGPKEKGVSESLIVGETTPNQYRKKVIGFQCPGLKIRVDHQGVRRPDEECGPCGLAWLPPTALATAGVIGVIVTDEDPEPSPSRP